MNDNKFNHESRPSLSRRRALQVGAAGAFASVGAIGFPMFVSSRVLGKDAPSKRITLGFIGVGGHGLGYNLPNFLKHGDAEVLAVCDVFTKRQASAQNYVHRKTGKEGCKSYAD